MNARFAALALLASRLVCVCLRLAKRNRPSPRRFNSGTTRSSFDKFMATYGVKSEVEPKISADENDLFERADSVDPIQPQTRRLSS